VLIVETELPTLQKKHVGYYYWRRNYPLFINNTTGATSGVGTAHSSEATRPVLLVEKELSSIQK
jgi:hypothetical protein